MPTEPAFFQGRIVPLPEARVSVMTHALHYGTGVFEGIRANWNGQMGKVFVFRMREHYQRFLRNCRVMLLDIPYSVEDLCSITVEFLQSCGRREDLYIRPLAYKSAEQIANLKLQDLASDFTLVAMPLGIFVGAGEPLRCCTSSWRRIDDTAIPPRVKLSGLYVNSVLAKTEATLAGFDEAILLNQNGTVSEATTENVFLVSGGVLHTPSLADHAQPGITRDSVMQLARDELGLETVQRSIQRSELYLADEVFLTATAAHINAVGYLDSRPIGDGSEGPVTRQIRDLYFEVIRGDRPDYGRWLSEVPLEP